LSDGYSVTPTWRPALPLVVAGLAVAGVPVVEHGKGEGGVMRWWGTASGGRQPGQAALKEKEADRRRRWRGGRRQRRWTPQSDTWQLTRSCDRALG
jgi:hypothetical protein